MKKVIISYLISLTVFLVFGCTKDKSETGALEDAQKKDTN